jgi:hypothetical protein
MNFSDNHRQNKGRDFVLHPLSVCVF